MFKDYYKILGILPTSNVDEIKKAYRQLSLKWHPDRNPYIDVTDIMQDINEAYAILKDVEKKARYDKEYSRFVSIYYDNDNKKECPKEYTDFTEKKNKSKNDYSYDYEVHNEKVKEDINYARDYAKELVDEFMRSFKEASQAAVKGAANNAFKYIIGWILSGIFLALISSLFKMCN